MSGNWSALIGEQNARARVIFLLVLTAGVLGLVLSMVFLILDESFAGRRFSSAVLVSSLAGSLLAPVYSLLAGRLSARMSAQLAGVGIGVTGPPPILTRGRLAAWCRRNGMTLGQFSALVRPPEREVKAPEATGPGSDEGPGSDRRPFPGCSLPRSAASTAILKVSCHEARKEPNHPMRSGET